MKYLKFSLFLLFSNLINGQIINENYCSIGEGNSEIVIFKNDSLVDILPFRPHLYNLGIKNLKYQKLHDTIFIKRNNIVEKYQIIESALVNYAERKVLVLRKDFNKDPDIYALFRNKFYIVGKRNRELKLLLKQIDEDKIVTKIIKGFDAYEKYGYKYSFGVILIEEK